MNETIPVLKDHPDLPLYIDSTMLTAFRSCERKQYWGFVQNIQPLGQSIHLLAGAAFASGCDAARKAQAQVSFPLSTEQLLEAALPAFLKSWGEYEADPEDAKNFHNTFSAFETYICERYHPFYDEVQPYRFPNGQLASEYSFSIPLDIKHPSGDPFIFVGRFDELGLWQGSLPVLLDEKTTSQMGASWSRQWDLRGQFIGYAWAARQLGYPISTVIVRGVAIQKTQHQFQQLPVSISDHLIDEWVEELYNTLTRYITCYTTGKWSKCFGDACSAYGGCSYLDLCKAKHPENWITNYEVRTWSPINQGEA